ncbi:alpha/beta fold hydrolase (plasmid) [Bradyrhizobium sp. vgs-9]
MSTYVLIHAAWHTGEHYWPTASLLRAAGHHVFTPTMSGNRLGDQKTTGLAESIESVVEFISERNLGDVVLVGHSYGGIVITGVADRIAHRLRRLVYL